MRHKLVVTGGYIKEAHDYGEIQETVLLIQTLRNRQGKLRKQPLLRIPACKHWCLLKKKNYLLDHECTCFTFHFYTFI